MDCPTARHREVVAGPTRGRQGPTRTSGSLIIAVALCLAGCATYAPRPLPSAPEASASVFDLKADVDQLRLAPLRQVVVDPADGLTPVEVAVLAVLNSPDLVAKRKAAGVSAAQVFAAGLLPDPQISAGVDQPVAGPDHQTAFNLSAALDLGALLARSSTRRAAAFTSRQADLDLLWAEWSVAQQARTLAETVMANETRAGYLNRLLALADDRYARSERALQHHDVTLQTTAADLAVKLDIQAQLATVERDARKARADLNALLDLAAEVRLPLVQTPGTAVYDAAALRAARTALPARRPDLLALQAGYGAQDANLRKAILAQFPLTSVGLALAKDPAGVVTQGISAAFNLPVFNGGRGEVRVQEATREQLRAEYQARLDQAAAEAAAAVRELAAAREQAALLRAEVPRLEALVRPAVAAYERGDIDSQTYLTLSQSALGRRADLEDRELAARVSEIQLETALFLPPAESRATP